VTEKDLEEAMECQLEIIDGYHRFGALMIIRNNPQLLLSRDIGIDWHQMAKLYPTWITIDRFVSRAPTLLFPPKTFHFEFFLLTSKLMFVNYSCSQLRRGSITFGKVAPANICPSTVCGKVYIPDLSVSDIRLISSVCNDNQTFLVEYTPYDNLQYRETCA
jgi:hypothetical protein